MDFDAADVTRDDGLQKRESWTPLGNQLLPTACQKLPPAEPKLR